MAIEYVEVRNLSREIVGIIDTAKSIIWHTEFYGVGDFEIYVQATPAHFEMLQIGFYVTRPETDDVGIIEKVTVTENNVDGNVIIASGSLAKSLLSRRLIYQLSGVQNTVTTLRGNVEQSARNLVYNNAINCEWNPRRNFSILKLASSHELPAIIKTESGTEGEKQTSYDNLLEYTDEFLHEYGYGARVLLDRDDLKFKYEIFQGNNRTVTASYDPIIFSTDYDNLTDSEYNIDTASLKNFALIGGEGEGAERFYSALYDGQSGLDRREAWVDARSVNKSLKSTEMLEAYPNGEFVGTDFKIGETIIATLVIDEDKTVSLNSLEEKFPDGYVDGYKYISSGVEIATEVYGEENKYNYTPLGYKMSLDVDEKEGEYLFTDAQYDIILKTKAMQELAELVIDETMTGSINDLYGNWKLNVDYFLGDYVTIQNNLLGKYIDVQIVDCTEVYDENGYTYDAKFEIVSNSIVIPEPEPEPEPEPPTPPPPPPPLQTFKLCTEGGVAIETEDGNVIIIEQTA